jgi:hypothetical protein
MAQHDYVIENQSGAAFRADLNNGLAAIVSQNSGTSQPSTTYAYQWWADTTTGLLKIRNAANNAWVTVGTLADVNLGLLSLAGGTLTGALLLDDSGTVSAPALAFDGDDNTGIFRSAADTLNVATNGVERVEFGTSEVVFNDGGANYDFRIEGDTNSSLFFVDASAEAVGIGNTSPSAVLDVSGNSKTSTLQIGTDPAGVNIGVLGIPNQKRIYGRNAANTGDVNILYIDGSNGMVFGPGDAAVIDSSGRLLVGTSSASGVGLLQVQGQPANSTLAGVIDIRRGSTNPSSGTDVGYIRFGDSAENFAAHISCISDGTWGSGDYPGRLVFSTTADGASSPTERMRITNSGFVTNKTANIGSVTGAGWSLESIGVGVFTVSGNPVLYVNRTTNDGNLINFYQDSILEGNISVSGTTVSYNGAHLSRWSQLPGGAEREEILRGTVLSNIDEMCDWGEEQNEQLNRMKVSDVEGDPNVSGVFQAWDDDDDTYTDDFYCAMTGDFIIRIAEGTVVQRGDLLMSAGDGTAKPQDDDIIRSKTIAKVTSTHVTCTYNDGSYCVPCVLMAC